MSFGFLNTSAKVIRVVIEPEASEQELEPSAVAHIRVEGLRPAFEARYAIDPDGMPSISFWPVNDTTISLIMK
jgi:hypothetical protein